MRIALVAGEASGDLLGAGLVASLRKIFPNAQFAGVCGPNMRAEGVEEWHDSKQLSVMGLAEVLRHLPRLLRLRRELRDRLLAWKPDVFIGIAAPDFNLGLERALKQADSTIPVPKKNVKRQKLILSGTSTQKFLVNFRYYFFQQCTVKRCVQHTEAFISLLSISIESHHQSISQQHSTILIRYCFTPPYYLLRFRSARSSSIFFQVALCPRWFRLLF